jgi:uncharacterized membrane protein YqjE
MVVDPRGIRVEGGAARGPMMGEEPPLRDLFRQLSEDGARLIRQEVALGKVELRETATAVGRDAVRIGVAVGVGLLGAMAATAFLIVGLGALLENYWLSALIVTVVLLGVAGMMARRAIEDLKHRDIKPTQTLETLRADAEWAKREVEVVKSELKSNGSRTPGHL